LLRTSRVGEQSGVLENTQILDQALTLVDRQHQPLLASTLLAERGFNAWLHDPANTQVRPELLEAVQLTASFPDSPERAVALAHLVDAEVLDLRTGEIPLHIWGQVLEAVEMAQRSSSGAALARVLSCRARYLQWDLQSIEAIADAEASYVLARQTGQVATMELAAIRRFSALWELGRVVEAADLGQAASQELFALGSSQ